MSGLAAIRRRAPAWLGLATVAAAALAGTPAHAATQRLFAATRMVVTAPARSVHLFSSTAVAAPTATTTATPSIAFPVMSRDQQVNLLGINQRVEPPDTMVAAGPAGLLEVVNRSASAWSRTGALVGSADLDVALGLPAGWLFSDPRVLYDAPTGRFFVSGTAIDAAGDSFVVLAVSQSAQIGSGWFVSNLAYATAETHDQPKLGVSDDKVVLSWGDFGPGSTSLGAETWVLNKASLLNGVPASAAVFGPTPGQLSLVPVQSLTSTSTEYVVENGGDHVAVFAVDGVPGTSSVTMAETDLAAPLAAQPPPAQQPGGQLNSGDNRLLSAVWVNGALWASGNAGCLFSGSPTLRACSRLLRISTANGVATVAVLQLGAAFSDLIYPAVTVSPAGNVFVAATATSATMYASAAVIEIAAASPAPTYNLFQMGQQTYPGSQWGDYSSISVDPSTGTVWAAAEYAIAGGTPGDWGTAAANLPG